METEVLYSETQTAQKTWVLAVILVATLGTIGLFTWAVVQQIFLGIPWGTKPLPDIPLVIMAVAFSGAMVLVLFLTSTMRMEIRITAKTLEYGIFPLNRRLKTLERSDIQEARAVAINPLRDFGGYGIKTGNLGKGYLMDVTEGVLLTLFQGPRITLGSQNPGEILRILGFGGR